VTNRATNSPEVKVLVFPRSPNPYQRELYTAMAASDRLVVRYVDGPTPSQTLNLLALPLLLAIGRLRGYRILHVHWVYSFGVAWAHGRRARRVVERWYSFTLAVASALGLKMVWTAHNLVPHEPVFVDDVAARRALVARCDAVIAHDDSAATIVRTWGARRVAVVPGGVELRANSDTLRRTQACAAIAADPRPMRALFFGSIRDYKGVDVLLDALASLHPDVALHVDVVGPCLDPARRTVLEAMVRRMPVPERVDARFDYVPDDELAAHIAASDFGVFPFRSVTNSSSVLHSLAAGLPVIIPSLAALGDVPEGAAIRYQPADGRDGLVHALTAAATMDCVQRAAMVASAVEFASTRTWPKAAAATWVIFEELLADAPMGLARRALSTIAAVGTPVGR